MQDEPPIPSALPPAVAAAPSPRPSWRFALASPWHFIATFGGSGVIHPAPGTWGTAAAWLSFVVGSQWWGEPVWIALILVTFFLGAWGAQRMGEALGKPDHGAIVIDEVVAFWIILLVLPKTFAVQAAAFVVFRLFDIVKPPPIRQIDRRFKNGFGVMLDDLLAALYTLVVFAIAARVMA
ncbi:MAG: phosphatidylglycerophosphatase A [Burkholderiaceae bacterium]